LGQQIFIMCKFTIFLLLILREMDISLRGWRSPDFVFNKLHVWTGLNLRHHRLNASMPVPRWQKAAVSPTVSAANPDTQCFFTAFYWPFCSLTVNDIACLKGVSLVSLTFVGVLNLLKISRIPLWKFFTVPICESYNYSYSLFVFGQRPTDIVPLYAVLWSKSSVF